ncbi:secreted signal peptide protein [Xanthomonas theicola]|uniref:Secreted signal peptide protein n=1 Tax=Xanthomonas theicola TaxID=56464 RepID=A0A2S6ZAK2_9XANT|nr:secreted signal peptide protein [Xanthomonas theicola]PPT79508.1 secreted signal peptide protein [Xanthomonas theicola]QNH25375.1 secreted signal peptide protein [Xanthomonas theicola]
MTPRSLSLLGLLALGTVLSAGAEAAACTSALHQAFASSSDAAALPAPCRRIGLVELGMSKQQVQAALGQPDALRTDDAHPDTSSAVYLYPPGFNAQLARKPLAADRLDYSQLGLRFRNGKVVNIVAFANPKAPFPFQLLAPAADADADSVLKRIGGQPQWNASRDYVQFAAMPIGLNVDPDTSRIVGLDIADSKQDLDAFALPALHLSKDAGSGLVGGVR